MDLSRKIAASYRKLVEACGAGIVVKTAFPVPQHSDYGSEWMFCEVTRFEGEKVFGTLLNHPQLVPGLAHGDEVEINEICFAEVPKWGSDDLRQRWDELWKTRERFDDEIC